MKTNEEWTTFIFWPWNLDEKWQFSYPIYLVFACSTFWRLLFSHFLASFQYLGFQVSHVVQKWNFLEVKIWGVLNIFINRPQKFSENWIIMGRSDRYSFVLSIFLCKKCSWFRDFTWEDEACPRFCDPVQVNLASLFILKVFNDTFQLF